MMQTANKLFVILWQQSSTADTNPEEINSEVPPVTTEGTEGRSLSEGCGLQIEIF